MNRGFFFIPDFSEWMTNFAGTSINLPAHCSIDGTVDALG
jgi:hypothetical protein